MKEETIQLFWVEKQTIQFSHLSISFFFKFFYLLQLLFGYTNVKEWFSSLTTSLNYYSKMTSNFLNTRKSIPLVALPYVKRKYLHAHPIIFYLIILKKLTQLCVTMNKYNWMLVQNFFLRQLYMQFKLTRKLHKKRKHFTCQCFFFEIP